jgi:hypothetical protein
MCDHLASTARRGEEEDGGGCIGERRKGAAPAQEREAAAARQHADTRLHVASAVARVAAQVVKKDGCG